MVLNVQESVTVSTTSIPLNEHHLDTLRSLVDPLAECEDHGVAYYSAVKAFLHIYYFTLADIIIILFNH